MGLGVRDYKLIRLHILRQRGGTLIADRGCNDVPLPPGSFDDRVVHALKDAPAYPDELAETTGLALGTVKNCLTRLRRVGKVGYTGELRGQTKQIQLVSSPSLLYRGSDSDDGSENKSARRLSHEEVEEVKRLTREGMAPHLARAQVLGCVEEELNL